MAVLRSPENDDLSKFLLSLLCMAVGMEGGTMMMLPPSQIPKPILDGLREMLASGTPNQKLGILHLVQMSSWSGQSGLMGDQALIDRCGALLSDPDPMVRVTAVQALQEAAPKRADQRFEVLQGLWRTSTDPSIRATCLGTLASMDAPAAREFLLKSLQEVEAGGIWTKDGTLMWAVIQSVQTRLSMLHPKEEEAYAALCSSALRGVSEPMWYRGWMDLALRLPLPRATALLDQAQGGAPTPELQAAARRVLDQIRAGETRSERLQAEVRKQN